MSMKRELPVVTYMPLRFFGCRIGVSAERPPLATDRAISANCCGVDHLPNRLMTSALISFTDATLLFERHWLHTRWLPAVLRMSVGEPPFDTGTSSSSSNDRGWPAGTDGSIGSPHIQHGRPSDLTRRQSASRPARLRGLRLLICALFVCVS